MNKFVIDSVEYSSTNTAEYVFRDETTLGYCFINTGNCSVTINNYILLPNSSLCAHHISVGVDRHFCKRLAVN